MEGATELQLQKPSPAHRHTNTEHHAGGTPCSTLPVAGDYDCLSNSTYVRVTAQHIAVVFCLSYTVSFGSHF